MNRFAIIQKVSRTVPNPYYSGHPRIDPEFETLEYSEAELFDEEEKWLERVKSLLKQGISFEAYELTPKKFQIKETVELVKC